MGTALACLLTGMLLAYHLLPLWYVYAGHVTLPTEPSVASRLAQKDHYLYYVLKQSGGFVLARALAGAESQPVGTPHVVASFGDDFGQTSADTIISLQPSPDGRYVAIDGTRSDGELLWIFDTRYMTLNLEPANASGTFLHWLPGSSDVFLYRPMFPVGPYAPLDKGSWNPGLWEVNAATGKIINLAIRGPSAYLVDAAASPNGSQIIYSTSAGLGEGSDIWLMNVHGQRSTHLLSLSGGVSGIAGMFAWSPNGQSIAYESLVDSPTPFLPAGVWVMNRQGSDRHFLAEADGGHGFALNWSPDGTKIAFVARTNPGQSMADQSTQALKSAIEVVNVSSGHAWTAASSVQTGAQINADPLWSADSSRITFAAYNPLNPDLGGTVRYWSVSATPDPVMPSVVPLSQPVTHVIMPG
jgi:WD40 repeat protein